MKAKVQVITGAPNSGQKEYAKDLALREIGNVKCIITSQDISLESSLLKSEFVPLNIASKVDGNKVALILSITHWVENVFTENSKDYTQALSFCKSEWKKIQDMKVKVIVTSTELSHWGPSMTKADKDFVNLHGEVNKFIGSNAGTVNLLVAGKSMWVMN